MFAKRIWLNIALLALVIVLALIAWLEPGGKKKTDTLSPLLSLTADQVERIRLLPGADRHIDLTRGDNGWMISYPIQIAANDFRVDSILQLTQADSYAHYPAAAQALAPFGLDPPQSEIQLNDVTIAFGDNEPIHHRRYVRVGDQVHLINDRYFYSSQLLLSALVDTALLPADAVPVRIQLPDRLLTRVNGDWHVEPDGNGVSMDAINGLVDAWRNARAVQVSEYHEDKVQDTIDVSLADGTRLSFELLSRSPELLLGRRDLGLRYHFTAEQAGRLLNLAMPAGSDSTE